MAEYYISGIWKASNVITHYAFHRIENKVLSKIQKKSKLEAVKLLANSSNVAKTIVWNYKKASWLIGEIVTVVNGRYLRSNPDKTETDNLGHLIDYSLIKL